MVLKEENPRSLVQKERWANTEIRKMYIESRKSMYTKKWKEKVRKGWFKRGHKLCKRENHPNWKGGFYLLGGYKVILVSKGRYVQEHRQVMKQAIGRSLAVDEIVHHINGNKVDNRIENLQLMKNSEHWYHHNKDLMYSKKGGK